MEITNKIKQALSKLKSFRLYSVINILGLALSLACTMFFAMYIHQEYTADSFHSKIDDIYCITEFSANDGRSYVSSQIEGALRNGGSFFLSEYPEISKKCRIHYSNEDVSIKIDGIEQKSRRRILRVDSTFFDIFDFPLIIGDPEKVLKAPKTAVIRESFAKRIFPNTNPIGQTFSWGGMDITIEGIASDHSYISALNFDILIKTPSEYRLNSRGADFLLLEKNANIEALREKLAVPKIFSRFAREFKTDITPLKGLYLNSSIDKPTYRSGNESNNRVLTLAAIIVLIIGLFNFINIQSVTTIKRGKELGVKKVFGASKGSMFLQFYIEDLMMVMASTLLASLLVELFIPLAQKWLSLTLNHIWSFDAMLIGGVIFILPLLTALIPYIKYTYSMPLNAIKDIGIIVKGKNSRNIFIVLQNIMTVIMIVTAIYFISQFKTMLNTDIGFNPENIMEVSSIERWRPSAATSRDEMRIEMEERNEKLGKYQQYVDERLSSTPAIHSYFFGGSLITNYSNEKYKLEGEEEFKQVYGKGINSKVLDFYGIDLIDGNLFNESESNSFTAYLANRGKVIATESALKYFGITGNWQNAILEDERRGKYQIIGVVKDIRPQKLSEPSRPTIFEHLFTNIESPINIRYQEGKEEEVIAILQDVSKNTSGTELSYNMATDQIEKRYIEERRTATTYSLFALIAILISSMGLFGLSFFDVQQKYREIALRKVNGATVADIIKLLSAKYAKLLSISFIIAVPIAYWAITKYTESFITKAPLAWWIFLTAMIITTLISMLTLWWQTLKAAKENPAIAMKRE